jgi:membrane protease subunit HflK
VSRRRLIEEANGYRQSVISTSQGDASRFRQILTEYEKAPQVTRERMYLETMQNILSATSKVIVDQKAGGGSLLYLPLDRLMTMTGSGTALETRRPARRPRPSPAVPAAPEPARRDSLRSRDREGGR